MGAVEVECASVLVKEAMDRWSEAAEFDALERLETLLEESFRSGSFCVEEAAPDEESLSMVVSAPTWKSPRDFLLLPDGNLVWSDRRPPPRVRWVR